MDPKPVLLRPEVDALADAFFRQSSLSPVEIGNDSAEDFDDLDGRDELPRGARRAQLAALSIFAVSVCAVGGFLLYSKVLMPTPVELGTGGGVTIPVLQPIAASEAPEQQPGLVTFHAAPPPSAAVAVAAPTAAVPATPAASTPTAATAAPKATAARTTPRASQVASDEASPQDALVKQAFRSLNAGRFDNAIAQARRALDSAPGRADAWLVLGSAYDGLKDHHSAQLAFRACAARARGSFVSECKKLAR